MTGANADRQQRLAAALRANLKRRKTAAKARDLPPEDAQEPQQSAGKPSDGSPEDADPD